MRLIIFTSNGDDRESCNVFYSSYLIVTEPNGHTDAEIGEKWDTFNDSHPMGWEEGEFEAFLAEDGIEAVLRHPDDDNGLTTILVEDDE